jgi:cobalt-zinc-cadmium resistance protein CzcA
MMKKVEKIYLEVLLKLLRVPKIVFGVVAILFITAVFILAKMGGEFIPSLEEGDFAVDTRVFREVI